MGDVGQARCGHPRAVRGRLPVPTPATEVPWCDRPAVPPPKWGSHARIRTILHPARRKHQHQSPTGSSTGWSSPSTGPLSGSRPGQRYLACIHSRLQYPHRRLADSQKARKPVFTLTQEDVRRVGSVWDQTAPKIEEFRQTFERLAERIEALTITKD